MSVITATPTPTTHAAHPTSAAAQALRLPPQLFASVLSTLRRPGGLDKSEMRRTTRMPVWARLSVYKLDTHGVGEPIRMLARDISMEGIGLMSGVLRARGEAFVIELPREGADSTYLACRSVHCVELGTSLYSIGACFTGEVNAGVFRNSAKTGTAHTAAPATHAAHPADAKV